MAYNGIINLDPNLAVKDAADERDWYDAANLTIGGKLWADTAGPYSRLPAAAHGLVRDPVWQLSRHSAGVTVDFETDSPSISVRWSCTGSMPHMARSGLGGVDLYVKHEQRWKWLAIGIPREDENSQELVGGLNQERRTYRLYLPLYSPVHRLEIGVPSRTSIGPARPEGQPPIVVYGTSIVQGGCASRPGMAYPAICGRETDRPWVNLGFSGNGKLEEEVFRMIADRRSALILVDCLPNTDAELVRSRMIAGIRIIRAAQPAVPIGIIENIRYSSTYLVDSLREKIAAKNSEARAAYADVTRDGITGVTYIETGGFTGTDHEGAVDGTHLTDLGFKRMADHLVPVVKEMLNG